MAVSSAMTAWGVAGPATEPLRRPLLVSGGAHACLVGLSLLGLLTPHGNGGWGEGGAGGAVTVRLVSGASVPLPAPVVSTDNRVATENRGLHRPEPVPQAPKKVPVPKPSVPEKAVELPSRTARRVATTATPREEAKLDNPPAPAVRPRNPSPAPERQLGNEIPYGEGGPAQGPFGVFTSDAGTGGVRASPGSGDFGLRYGWYVTAIRNRISTNWLKATVDPGVRVAPRVYVTFEILRDGAVVNTQMTASSGIPSLDRSALRAVLESNPMPPLPADYARSSVAVEFWFDFQR